jgi:ectoine hydroxylase-related dioxygenase (phytanoyl-CoA dioxygenase family)
MQAPLRAVTDVERANFERDGAVCLRGLFDNQWIDRLRSATDRSMAQKSANVREYDTNDGGRFHANMFLWLDDPDVHDFVTESPAGAIAAALMGSDRVSFFFDHLLVKEPGTENATPWHQDLPYWPVAGHQIVSLWFAMDDVDIDSGGVRYVAGSHLWSDEFQARSFDGSTKYSDLTKPEAPDPDQMDVTVLTWDLAPGDVVAHHVRTLHGAPGNRVSDRRRRGLATRWCGDGATFDPRPFTMPLPRDPGIAAGDPMDCEMFPVVYRRP